MEQPTTRHEATRLFFQHYDTQEGAAREALDRWLAVYQKIPASPRLRGKLEEILAGQWEKLTPELQARACFLIGEGLKIRAITPAELAPEPELKPAAATEPVTPTPPARAEPQPNRAERAKRIKEKRRR